MAGDDVLFTITRDHLDTGLRGFPVGTCPISHVDAVEGLSYGGIPIAQLAHLEPEEVIHLLLRKTLPDPATLAVFHGELVGQGPLHPGIPALLPPQDMGPDAGIHQDAHLRFRSAL